jgi:hypothetical protein
MKAKLKTSRDMVDYYLELAMDYDRIYALRRMEMWVREAQP